jgi:hypothetical protein
MHACIQAMMQMARPAARLVVHDACMRAGGGAGSEASSEGLGELELDAEHVDFMTAPDSFCCPITHEILRNPVVASDGCALARCLAFPPLQLRVGRILRVCLDTCVCVEVPGRRFIVDDVVLPLAACSITASTQAVLACKSAPLLLRDLAGHISAWHERRDGDGARCMSGALRGQARLWNLL